MSDEKSREEPGPKPDRLVIESNPGEALDRLVGKQPEAETHHKWRPLDRYDKVTNPAPGVVFRCRECGHYARSNSVPGPCPPPDRSRSPKILD